MRMNMNDQPMDMDMDLSPSKSTINCDIQIDFPTRKPPDMETKPTGASPRTEESKVFAFPTGFGNAVVGRSVGVEGIPGLGGGSGGGFGDEGWFRGAPVASMRTPTMGFGRFKGVPVAPIGFANDDVLLGRAGAVETQLGHSFEASGSAFGAGMGMKMGGDVPTDSGMASSEFGYLGPGENARDLSIENFPLWRPKLSKETGVDDFPPWKSKYAEENTQTEYEETATDFETSLREINAKFPWKQPIRQSVDGERGGWFSPEDPPMEEGSGSEGLYGLDVAQTLDIGPRLPILRRSTADPYPGFEPDLFEDDTTSEGSAPSYHNQYQEPMEGFISTSSSMSPNYRTDFQPVPLRELCRPRESLARECSADLLNHRAINPSDPQFMAEDGNEVDLDDVISMSRAESHEPNVLPQIPQIPQPQHENLQAQKRMRPISLSSSSDLSDLDSEDFDEVNFDEEIIPKGAVAATFAHQPPDSTSMERLGIFSTQKGGAERMNNERPHNQAHPPTNWSSSVKKLKGGRLHQIRKLREITPAMDLYKYMPQPFTPLAFRSWIVTNNSIARLRCKLPNPSSDDNTQRMMFEFLDASTEQKNLDIEEEAVNLLKSVDVWLRRNAIGASREQQHFLDQSKNIPNKLASQNANLPRQAVLKALGNILNNRQGGMERVKREPEEDAQKSWVSVKAAKIVDLREEVASADVHAQKNWAAMELGTQLGGLENVDVEVEENEAEEEVQEPVLTDREKRFEARRLRLQQEEEEEKRTRFPKKKNLEQIEGSVRRGLAGFAKEGNPSKEQTTDPQGRRGRKPRPSRRERRHAKAATVELSGDSTELSELKGVNETTTLIQESGTPKKRQNDSPRSQNRNKSRVDVPKGQPLPGEESDDASNKDSIVERDLAKDVVVKKGKLRPSWKLTSMGKGTSKSVVETGRVKAKQVIVISSDESSHNGDSSDEQD